MRININPNSFYLFFEVSGFLVSTNNSINKKIKLNNFKLNFYFYSHKIIQTILK